MQTYILTFLQVYGLITANMEKTLKENLFFLRDFREPAGVRAGIKGWNDLVPESVL